MFRKAIQSPWKVIISYLLLILVATPGWTQIPEYEMVHIRAGTFMMGSPRTEVFSREDEQLHQVTLTRDYLIGRFEVTQEFFQEITGTNPSYNNACPQCPVEMVSWRDAVLFCNIVSRKAGLKSAYKIHGNSISLDLDAPGYRLPTEAEWEYSCRAGSRTIFPNGNCLSSAEANINTYLPQPGCEMGMNRAQTIPVGSFAPNGWGLYDMIGNINEFCWDWYAFYQEDDQIDPTGGPSAKYRVFRGGAFNNFPTRGHSASRQKMKPHQALDMVGLRLVRTVVPEEGKKP